MSKPSRYAFILILILLLTCGKGFAQPALQELPIKNSESITEMATNTKTELQSMFVQWRQAHAKDPITAIAFHSFVLSKRMSNPAYSQTQYNAFKQNLYQPVYVLPNGAWVMGFENKSTGSIGVWVDVNGGDAPGYRGSGDTFDQKEFVLNAQGQVVQVLN